MTQEYIALFGSSNDYMSALNENKPTEISGPQEPPGSTDHRADGQIHENAPAGALPGERSDREPIDPAGSEAGTGRNQRQLVDGPHDEAPRQGFDNRFFRKRNHGYPNRHRSDRPRETSPEHRRIRR